VRIHVSVPIATILKMETFEEARRILYHNDVDHSEATYITNYVYVALALPAVIYWKYKGSFSFLESVNITIATSRQTIVQALCQHLIWSSLALLFGAIVHQHYPHAETAGGAPIEFSILWRITTFCAGIDALYVWDLGDGIRNVSVRHADPEWLAIVLNVGEVLFVLCFVVMVFVNMDGASYFAVLILFTGFFYVMACAIISYWRMTDNRKLMRTFIFGSACCNIGILIAAALNGACAHEEHELSEHGCPFSADFNPNAIFHVLYIIGMISFIYGCLEYPDIIYLHPEFAPAKHQIALDNNVNTIAEHITDAQL